ncbi:hypothetical protein WCN79_16025 [Xanthomonas axonopodis pv. vasculorum]|uniref:hypothetical protein n=1 Tax=Xanthomonas axonopodis TaxID=53413 RepID=UPI003D77C927
MAGDVVSAASPHLGEVVSLASQDDIHSLRAGRYLDAPACAPPPNALLAMRLDDHGGQQHFHSKSPDNVLQPQRFQQAAQRYAQHQAVIERFGRDVSAARATTWRCRCARCTRTAARARCRRRCGGR